MSKAADYIERFNGLLGRPAGKAVLSALHKASKGVRGAEEVYRRTGEALKAMGTRYGQIILEVKPVAVPAGAPATAKKKPVKRKRKAFKPLSGVMSVGEMRKMQFEEIELDGRYKDEFVKLYSDTQIMIWGRPTHGKTVYILQFVKYLATEQDLRVLYLASEEYGRSTWMEKLNQFDIPDHRNLTIARDLVDVKGKGLKIEDFDVVVFDSIQTLGMKLKDYTDFVRANPGRIYISVVQSTKGGEFKGGQEWEHEVDICGQIYNRKLKLSKNRLDPDNAMKNEQFLFESQVEEAKKRRSIREQVKSEIAPPASADGVMKVA